MKTTITNESICTKQVLSFREAVIFTGFSASYLYKLTASRQIPHFKPSGKMVFFDRVELEAWLLRNRVATANEINQEAQALCQKGGAR